MKIPEGWPTEEMITAGINAQGTADHLLDKSAERSDMAGAFIAMLAAAPTPPAQYRYEAACSGLRYTMPEACGNVSAIHIDGKRWPVAMDGWREAMSEALDVVAQYAPGFSLLIERMEKILDATTPPAQEDEPVAWMYTSRINTSDSQADGIDFDYTSIHQNKEFAEKSTGHIPLYTRPDNDGLRKAAEELLDHLHDAPLGKPPREYVDALRNELDKAK